jgi:nucleoside-diphosphate-sugar epimerase
MFDYFSHTLGTKVVHLRLNYAVELRYGVLVDIAVQVWSGASIDLAMGHLNCVWQGYANSVVLQAFPLAASPPAALNVTGPEVISIRWAAARLGELMGKTPVFVGEESGNALLSNAAACHALFGYPQVSPDTLLEWVAHWVMSGGELLNKPTHYATRDGRY